MEVYHDVMTRMTSKKKRMKKLRKKIVESTIEEVAMFFDELCDSDENIRIEDCWDAFFSVDENIFNTIMKTVKKKCRR